MPRSQPPERGLRIGLVAACSFPAPRGSQVFIDESARALEAVGAEVHLVAPRGPEQEALPYRAHGLWSLRAVRPRLTLAGVSLLARPVFDLALAVRLERVVRRQRLDVLLAHNYEGLAAALVVKAWTGVPVVYHAHNVAEDEWPWLVGGSLREPIRRLGRCFDGALPRRADAVVALSEDVAKHLIDRGADPLRMHVIPPGLDARPFVAWRCRKRKARVVFSGNLDAYQNLPVLLDAWRRVHAVVPGAELRIVTHAGELRRAKRLAAVPGVHLVCADALQDVARELGAAAVGVSPRQSWSGYPIKTLNYMAAALPTVAMQGAAKGLLAGVTGWVVEEESPAALAAALCVALQAPELCRRRGEAAAQRLERHHAWPQLAERLMGVVGATLAMDGVTTARPRAVLARAAQT